MGYSSYSNDDRAVRAETSGFFSNSVNENFKQNVKRMIHEDMNPFGIEFRECRDSEAHPNTVPIQFGLDVTGSMGHIPQDFIKDGLPTMMGKIIQKVPDASLMFGAVGDHECDTWPLQVAQFESGDAELDMWLGRTYLEGGGGGNMGESYLLAWYFAANHVKTDAWEKRNTKGFVFTVGDEPCLRNLPASAVQKIMGSTAKGQGNMKVEELLTAALVQNHVFHIFVEHESRQVDKAWRDLLGQNLLVVSDYRKIPELIADTVLSHTVVNSTVTKHSAADTGVNQTKTEGEPDKLLF